MLGRIVSALSTTVTATLPALRASPPTHPLRLSTGRLARLTPGAATLQHGDLTLLATYAPSPDGHLIADFRSRAAAHGVIPATWARRELQPVQSELLTSRLIDRSLRPLLSQPAQITVSVLSGPGLSVDALAVNAASAAIVSAGIDWQGPVGAARAVWVDRQVVVFPSEDEVSRADLCTFVAVNTDGRLLSLLFDAGRDGVKRHVVIETLRKATDAALAMIPLQKQLGQLVRQLRTEEGASSFPRRMPVDHVEKVVVDEKDLKAIYEHSISVYERAFVKCRDAPGKSHRACVVTEAQEAILEHFGHFPMNDVLRQAQLAARHVYRTVLSRDRVRIDGRTFDDIRPVRCERNVLPGNVHGSALFERGDTQVLACATIGLKRRSLRTEEYVDIAGAGMDRPFFVHYSFPPYATGEAGRFAGTANRREVGHSSLAERALLPVLDISNGVTSQDGNADDEYPYALRLSAEVLASDGSSSMATICAGSLALADAGAPIRESVAGVAMGLVSGARFPQDEDDHVILTDILGAEDHFGDMDMKVAGTVSGLTACQMDVKCESGLPLQIVDKVLTKAQDALGCILSKMHDQCGVERNSMSTNAPRVLHVPVDVGVTVKTLLKDRAAGLRDIEEKSNARLLFEGRHERIRIEGPDLESASKARELLGRALADIEIGTKLIGKVTDVKQTFAVLDVANGTTSGILHVSKMQINDVASIDGNDGAKVSVDRLRYPDVRSMVSKGDELEVVVIESSRERNVLRFSLPSGPFKSPIRSAQQLDQSIDAILAATRPSKTKL